MIDNRPIGMFDSGVGGLTVYKEIKKKTPNEKIIYIGDTKRFPYGSKAKETIIKASIECINFLLSKNVKQIVIACGTATSQALDTVREIYKVPIEGIISPTVRYIKKMNYKNVGVIATRGTIKSNAWEEKIKVNFGCSSLLSGWGQDYRTNAAHIFEKDGCYYLGIAQTNLRSEDISVMSTGCGFANISHTDVYPLSSIIAFTLLGNSSPDAINTVAAPIEEPCSIISALSFCSIIKFIQHCKSSLSNHPIPIYCPSLSLDALMLGINTLYPFSEKCIPIERTESGFE